MILDIVLFAPLIFNLWYDNHSIVPWLTFFEVVLHICLLAFLGFLLTCFPCSFDYPISEIFFLLIWACSLVSCLSTYICACLRSVSEEDNMWCCVKVLVELGEWGRLVGCCGHYASSCRWWPWYLSITYTAIPTNVRITLDKIQLVALLCL